MEPGSRPAKILIGVPVFNGSDCVREALDSILAQEHQDFRVVVSVDGNDERSFKACRPYADDARFSVVLQREQLGWAGNANWLMGQLVERYFCYWQHDDYCDPSYLRVLLRAAANNPQAACVFSDIQYFGTKSNRSRYPSIVGMTQARVLEQIERNYAIPLRGVIRAETIQRVGPIPTVADGARQDKVWMVGLAREGEILNVAGTTYYKRCRDDSVGAEWRSADDETSQRVALEWAAGVLKAALPAFAKPDHTRLLAVIVDRLVVPRGRRHFFHDPRNLPPDGRLRLVNTFLTEAARRFRIHPYADYPLVRREKLLEKRLQVLEPQSGEAIMIEALLQNRDLAPPA
jgi:glycosyltransferase involved in cell wall biosynthesis